MKAPIKVSLIEDERPFRESLVELIQCSPELSFVGAYANAESGLKSIPSQPPDVLIIDLNLPRLSGIECSRRLKAQLPDLKILVLTKYEDADRIFQALEAGANGYLLKRRAPSELRQAICDAYEGGAPMSSEVAARVVAYFHQRGRQNPEMNELSPREYEILSGLARGFLYKEIAQKLGISYQTVNGHIKRVYEKLHVHSRTAAVAKYLGVGGSH